MVTGPERQGINRLYHCGCCAPPRQIYYRLERPEDHARHESDHTRAEAPVSKAEQRRILRER